MSYELEDFDQTSQVCLAWIQHFQEKGTVDVDDLKQAFADIANSFDEAVENRAQEEDPDASSHTITWDNIVSASTYG